MKIIRSHKSWALVLAAALLGGVPAIGADRQAEVSSTTSKNPITGTVTETNKFKKHFKRHDGKKGNVDVEEKTKFLKDGRVEKKIDAKSSMPPAE